MSEFEIIIVVLTVLTAMLFPIAALVIRLIVKQTKKDDQLGQLIEDVKELVATNKESEQKNTDSIKKVVDEQGRIHSEMYEQMRIDRDATDRRLRFIEEYWMKRGQKPNE